MGQKLSLHENKRNWFTDIIFLLPAFVFTLSILLVRLKKLSMPMSDIYWSSDTDTSVMTNLFTWWKSIAIMGAGCLALVLMLAGYFSGAIRFKKNKAYLFMFVYIGFALFSLAFSDYRYFAIHGMNEHSEGIFVLIAYMILVVYLLNAVDSNRRLCYVVCCILLAASLLGLLGITQAHGHDFLATASGQKLITPNEIMGQGLNTWEMIDLLDKMGQQAYSFSETVYQTVYNPNYVPLYLILVVSLCALLFIYLCKASNGMKKLVSIPLLGIYILLLYNFFASNSASGYLGLTALFLSAVVVFRRYILKWIVPLLCLALATGGVMYVLQDHWWPEVKDTFFSLKEIVIQQVYAEDEIIVNYDYENDPASLYIPIDYIDASEGHLHFGINGAELDFARDEAHHAYTVQDGEGAPLYMTKIEGTDNEFQILDDRFHDYVKLFLSKDENNIIYLSLTTDKYPWRFRYDGEEFWYQNSVGKEVMLHPVEHSPLIPFSRYKFGTWRGRIWATTIPMLKHYMLKGAGPDVFPFVFPQDDYVTIYNCAKGSYSLSLVTDKAHNIYMQYWVNTGFPSLLAWLGLIGYYFVGAVRSFRRRGFEDFPDYINGAVFCGIIGFLATALLSDGSVNTMPMFYTMLGLGLAINAKDKWVKAEDPLKEGPAQMPEL